MAAILGADAALPHAQDRALARQPVAIGLSTARVRNQSEIQMRDAESVRYATEMEGQVDEMTPRRPAGA
jgi:hypothetical protein